MIVFTIFAVICAVSAADNLRLASEDPKVLQTLFTQFRADNHRVYSGPQEARLRLRNFRKFVKDAAKFNAEQSEETVGVTFFADLTEDEKMSYYGANVTEEQDPSVGTYYPESENLRQYRSSVSHKSRYGAVKHQGQCGSCWAFSAVGTVEGYNSMGTGRYTALSEQEVLDCSNHGSCRGGYHQRANPWIKQRGRLASGSQYRYMTRKGSCRSGSYKNYLGVRLTSCSWVSGYDRGLASALNKGPASVMLYNFHGVGVEGYKAGVLQTSSAPGNLRAMNHAVVAIGYTSSNWELRNSWGTGWGNRGYFTLSRSKQNNIGISGHAYIFTYTRNGVEEEE